MANEFGELPHTELGIPEDLTVIRPAVAKLKGIMGDISDLTHDLKLILGSNFTDRHQIHIIDRFNSQGTTENVHQRILSGEATLYEIVSDVDRCTYILREDTPIEYYTNWLSKYSYRYALLKATLPETAAANFRKSLNDLMSETLEYYRKELGEKISEPEPQVLASRENLPAFPITPTETHYNISIPTVIPGWRYNINLTIPHIWGRYEIFREEFSIVAART